MILTGDTPTILEAPVLKRSDRPSGVTPDVIVLHATDGGTALSSIDWLRHGKIKGKPVRASYHVIVEDDGRIYRCVPDTLKAWHAGPSVYGSRTSVNDFSLGLAWAIRNNGREAITAKAWDAAVWQCVDWCLRWSIAPTAITTHAAVCVPPRRKTDVLPAQLDLMRFRRDVQAGLA